MMNFHRKVAVFSLALMVPFSSPPYLAGIVRPANAQSNEEIGTVFGAFGGAILGNQIGRGKGKAIATITGAIVGSMIGGEIGKHLDDEDRRRLRRSTQKALNTGKTQTFSNAKTGVTGTVIVLNASVAAADDRCREVEQQITTKDGSMHKETIKACRGANGWEML